MAQISKEKYLVKVDCDDCISSERGIFTNREVAIKFAKDVYEDELIDIRLWNFRNSIDICVVKYYVNEDEEVIDELGFEYIFVKSIKKKDIKENGLI